MINDFQRINHILEDLKKVVEFSEVPVRTDIYEQDGQFILELELPGLRKEDIVIRLEGNTTLLIEGKKERSGENVNRNFFLRECRFGSFSKRFTIPDGLDVSKIKAGFENGVLSVRLARAGASKQTARNIKID